MSWNAMGSVLPLLGGSFCQRAATQLVPCSANRNLPWQNDGHGIRGLRMARKFFGTDGIRGRANAGVLTAELAMKVGQAAGHRFLRGEHKHRVIIGKDTRLSGYMMENALVAG